MAAIVSVNVYGVNGTALAANQTFGFPTSNILIRPAPAGSVMLGVAQATIIELLPQGTRVGSVQYSSPTALATIATSAG